MDVPSSPSDHQVESVEESFEKTLLLEPNNYKYPSFKRQGLKSKILFHTLTFLLAIAVTTLAGFLTRPFPARVPQTKTLYCGSTATEARAMGCTYDVLSNMWIPKPCIDHENLRHFKKIAQWQAYETRDATRQLTEDEMGEVVGPKTYFTPIREHLVHCALMWRRLHKGFQEDNRYLDTHVRAYGHTAHCTQIMIEFLEKDRSLMDKIVSQTIPGFSNCVVPA
ncbi:hypothetical protein DM02DRAFT_613431 [Periconia macrospinosa]|uniref:Uncharacterized protein n=1 Tax=Periconia macrospinosa TaxID=97972 RepID=A0A2V1DXY2_9PLEO|nr:hypothetical protein DM02DRAFT_613431 [Periconia macrospinosa]